MTRPLVSTPPSSQPLINITVVSETSQKHRSRPSSFQRLFSRQAASRQDEDSPPEDPFRRMVGWPFSRSPRKTPPTGEEDIDPGRESPYSLTSPAPASTSSLGSVVSANEQLFQLDEPSQNPASSPVTVVLSTALEQPVDPDYRHAVNRLGTDFGNASQTISRASNNRSIIESASGLLNDARRSSEGTEASHSMAHSEPDSFNDDPTPQASTFTSRPPLPYDPLLPPKGRLSLVVPPRDVDVLSLRPAIGVTPHAPSETESSVSLYSPSSPTSPGAHGSFPTFPSMGPSGSAPSPPQVPSSEPPNPPISGASNLESTAPIDRISPGQCKWTRSMTPPPGRRPPPTGPLPAVPSSSIPPVPPLPPLLQKTPMAPQSTMSPPRPAIVGAPPIPASALPPSPPGGLRLPSRLSWISGVRAVLPSPPASPTRPLKSLAAKTPLPPPSKAEKKRSISIGVIEAADKVQVRRTKSILLLGSKSKSNASLGTKRVHIHADVSADADANASRKPRRKSSSATVCGHPVSSDPGPGMAPMAGAELLVPRERRHSAPILSALDSKMPVPSADWTLSLPFCTDVPGNKLSPLLAPGDKPEEGLQNGEDWTLCMPLKVDAPGVGTTTVECDSTASTAEVCPTSTQLPTPSPSPTSSSFVRALEPEEACVPVPAEQSRPESPVPSLGPHVGGLDLAGGRGKRASGWHVYGWFDEVCVIEDDRRSSTLAASRPTSIPVSLSSVGKLTKNHVTAFRKTHDVAGRQSSQDSMSTVSTSETVFYSARSSLLVN